MKRNIGLLLLLIFSLGFSQNKEEINTKNEKELYRKNEVNLNVLMGVGLGYERILNNNISIGGSVFKFYNEKKFYIDLINLYTRYYLGKKPASGLFFEGFGMFNNQELTYDDNPKKAISIENRPKTKTFFALGGSVGYKWLINNYNINVNLGMGKNINDFKRYDKNYVKEYVYRLGLSIGYRF